MSGVAGGTIKEEHTKEEKAHVEKVAKGAWPATLGGAQPEAVDPGVDIPYVCW